MEKKKAIVCAVLYAIVIIGALTCSFFVKNDEFGLSLYQLITGCIANAWLGCSVKKFYDWLVH